MRKFADWKSPKKICHERVGGHFNGYKELEESYIPFQCMIVSDTNRFNVEGFQQRNTIFWIR